MTILHFPKPVTSAETADTSTALIAPELAAIRDKIQRRYRPISGGFDPARDIMAGSVEMRYREDWERDKSNSTDHFLGHGAKAVYRMWSDFPRNGAITASATAFTAAGTEEKVYDFHLADLSHGYLLLDACELAAGRYPGLLDEMEHIYRGAEAAAADAIARHDRGEAPAGVPAVAISPEIVAFLDYLHEHGDL